MRHRAEFLRVLVFVVVAAVCAATVVVAYGSVRFGESARYSAEFADASGLKEKDDVRVAGITVGRVESVEVGADNLARISFSMRSDVPVQTGSEGIVRYKNLLGQRYLEIVRGPQPTGVLADGGTLPVTQTHPALDLDELYNGFTPLFQGLEPAQVNQLAESLITVLQGQGARSTPCWARSAASPVRWPTATRSSVRSSPTSTGSSAPSTSAVTASPTPWSSSSS